MKKSVIFMIGIVFVIAVMIVGIFGVQSTVYDQIVSIEKVSVSGFALDLSSPLTATKSSSLDNTYITTLNYQENLTGVILYEATPNNATNRAVDFKIGNDKYGSVSNLGVVTFADLKSLTNKPALVVSFILTAQDAHKAYCSYNIVVKLQ